LRRDDAIRLLKECEPKLRARGVLGLSLFGSTARDEARPDSDLDVLIDLDMARLMLLTLPSPFTPPCASAVS
jgi:uncharacterized protein